MSERLYGYVYVNVIKGNEGNFCLNDHITKKKRHK